LFTLVGIAGEDDLDAPDLPSTITQYAPSSGYPEKINGQPFEKSTPSDPEVRNESRRNLRPSKPALEPDASDMVRDRLVGEIAGLETPDVAIEWAGQNLGAKNTLSAADARVVEAAFQDRMQLLQPDAYEPIPVLSVESIPPTEEASSERNIRAEA